jgi:hypothetical protein
MKKEFACPERPWKSTNNASNVPIISPNGTLSSGLGLHKRSGILFMTDYLTACGAEVASGPEVTTPVAFFQLRKLLLELARRDKHMDRVGGDHAIFDADSEFRRNLGDDFADALSTRCGNEGSKPYVGCESRISWATMLTASLPVSN